MKRDLSKLIGGLWPVHRICHHNILQQNMMDGVLCVLFIFRPILCYKCVGKENNICFLTALHSPVTLQSSVLMSYLRVQAIRRQKLFCQHLHIMRLNSHQWNAETVHCFTPATSDVPRVGEDQAGEVSKRTHKKSHDSSESTYDVTIVV